jgi:hypothetical protein
MRSIVRVVAIFAAATLPIAGLTASADAKKPKPKATPQIMITCSPNPVIETGQSIVQTVCQVESVASNAGSSVTISSTQLEARCPGPPIAFFATLDPGTPETSITLALDNDGNATVVVTGINCAPGTALIDASLDAPPFSTAITKLVMEPPQVTPPGLKAFPNPEVEVGDIPIPTIAAPNNAANSASEAYFIFYVETSPTWAEQNAELSSDQFTERCGAGVELANLAGILDGTVGPAGTVTFFKNFVPGATTLGSTGHVIVGPIDNDGNTVFAFAGGSCAAGKSTAIAEILNGGPTYSTIFNILPPAVTI